MGSPFSHPGTIYGGIWYITRCDMFSVQICNTWARQPGAQHSFLLPGHRGSAAGVPDCTTTSSMCGGRWTSTTGIHGFSAGASPATSSLSMPAVLNNAGTYVAAIRAHVPSVRISKSIQPSEDPDALARRPPLRTQAGHMQHREAAVVVTGVPNRHMCIRTGEVARGISDQPT